MDTGSSTTTTTTTGNIINNNITNDNNSVMTSCNTGTQRRLGVVVPGGGFVMGYSTTTAARTLVPIHRNYATTSHHHHDHSYPRVLNSMPSLFRGSSVLDTNHHHGSGAMILRCRSSRRGRTTTAAMTASNHNDDTTSSTVWRNRSDDDNIIDPTQRSDYWTVYAARAAPPPPPPRSSLEINAATSTLPPTTVGTQSQRRADNIGSIKESRNMENSRNGDDNKSKREQQQQQQQQRRSDPTTPSTSVSYVDSDRTTTTKISQEPLDPTQQPGYWTAAIPATTRTTTTATARITTPYGTTTSERRGTSAPDLINQSVPRPTAETVTKSGGSSSSGSRVASSSSSLYSPSQFSGSSIPRPRQLWNMTTTLSSMLVDAWNATTRTTATRTIDRKVNNPQKGRSSNKLLPLLASSTTVQRSDRLTSSVEEDGSGGVGGRERRSVEGADGESIPVTTTPTNEANKKTANKAPKMDLTPRPPSIPKDVSKLHILDQTSVVSSISTKSTTEPAINSENTPVITNNTQDGVKPKDMGRANKVQGGTPAQQRRQKPIRTALQVWVDWEKDQKAQRIAQLAAEQEAKIAAKHANKHNDNNQLRPNGGWLNFFVEVKENDDEINKRKPPKTNRLRESIRRDQKYYEWLNYIIEIQHTDDDEK